MAKPAPTSALDLNALSATVEAMDVYLASLHAQLLAEWPHLQPKRPRHLKAVPDARA